MSGHANRRTGRSVLWGVTEERTRRSGAFLTALLLALLAAAAVRAQAVHASAGPVLSGHGETLTWTRSGRHNTYRLMTKVLGERSLITARGTSFTPPAVAGATAFYRVKAAHAESGWSNVVRITYPGATEEELPVEEPPVEEEGAEVGRPKYRIDAASYFDPFSGNVAWMTSHLSLIKAYPPAGDVLLLAGLPVIGYHDIATDGFAPLTGASIDSYVSRVKRDASAGYAGTFMDDINWSVGFRDWSESRTLEPEKSRMGDLVEAVRAAIPTGIIELNSQYHDIWPLMKAHDPDVERALAKVDIVTKECGVGPTSGINTSRDYGELFQFIEALHAKRLHVTMTGDPNSATVATMEYNLATYLLANDGHDYINGEQQTPEQWWSGFDVSLGAADGPRQRSSSGVWKRAFASGVVYTVEPGAAPRRISLGKPMTSTEWGTVEALTLGPGQGAVLVGQ